MNYSRATEILGFTTPKSLVQNAELAQSFLGRVTTKTPLRYKVAATILVREYHNFLNATAK